ncbi:hypothetical protein [uncultured Paraglaciecola sp.]|uniref:hypothetical protein n=1 Tax=uncultured Paraglaciecola sp. TaxID=1765024 RepID=UPI0025D32D52|nr:hypothetical protein [uncultured Paraglaciecola sp.]
MSRINKHIPPIYRYFFYTVLSLCWLTGSVFWLLREFAFIEGDFGPEPHFLQYPVLQLHGLGAFFMLLSLGAIFTGHIPNTWSLGRAKKSGLWILSAVILSMCSAYSLYYLVQEDWHLWLGNGHALVGVSLPIILYVHIKIARNSNAKKKKCEG